MGNGPQARLPGRLCSFSDMGRMPHSERAPPSSGTAAPTLLPHPPPAKTPVASGQSPQSRSREANSQAATAAAGRPPPPPLRLPHNQFLRIQSRLNQPINLFIQILLMLPDHV